MKNLFHVRNSPGQESPEINLRGILIFAGTVICLLGMVFIGVKMLVNQLEPKVESLDRVRAKSLATPAIAASRQYFPQPREQVNPRADLKAFRMREDAELNTYGWLDQKAGVVRLPIERAMELISQRGLSNPTHAGEVKQ